MAHPTAVILVVGLNGSVMEHAPNLRQFADAGRVRRLRPVLPAVTCSVQASMLTGVAPNETGIVGNGWYDRELAEVRFWHRSGRLVGGEKVWEAAKTRDGGATCLNMFWRYAAYSTADACVIERPIYKADGRKLPDCYSSPPELRDEIQRQLGTFPLFRFWGPAADITSTRWIADATILAHRKLKPTLTLTYLPHLDYCLQKLGPDHADVSNHVKDLDAVAGKLLDYFREAGVRVIIAGEYGIEPVDDAVHVNRLLRDEGGLRVRVEDGGEVLDAGASRAFAVADHQVAHVYIADGANVDRYVHFFKGIAGIEHVLTREEQRGQGIDHPRGGELVLVADPRKWFSYDYWLDEQRAPDFARTVAIHDKPGYDPLDLFIDPAIAAPKLRIAGKLLRKKLGFRTLMSLIPLDTKLVRGSHGRVDQPAGVQPVLITQDDAGGDDEQLPCMAMKDVILRTMFDG